MAEERIILGIDPGTNVMGYGIIACNSNKYRLLDMGTVHMTKITDPIEKLQTIYNTTTELIKKFSPTELAIEEPFYGKNVQSMLKLGRAQGMAIAAAISEQLSVHQYAARKIKQSITGKGSASKEQVAAMLKHTMGIDIPHFLDATDGLAVAVCHFNQKGISAGDNGKYNSWAAFIAKNPGRIS
jgi:crossover junction endodeoxyribonuclease RuvC